MRALVVVNPVATATTRATRNRVLRTLSGELKTEVAETAHRGHARALAAQAAVDGVDLVVTLGGDGTVNEVVNGLLEQGPAPHLPLLATVPGGSTNVFARALGRSRRPEVATAELLGSLQAGRTRRVALGTVRARGTEAGPETWTAPRWFVFAAGLGFDAEVIRRVENHRAGGRRSTGALYVAETTLAFLFGPERRRPAMTLHVPGRSAPDELFLCLVANVSPWTYLGPRPVNPTPQASFDTGLDVFALGRVGPLRMLRTAQQTMARQPDPRGEGVYRWHDLPELTIRAERPLDWQLDGDHLGSATALRLTSVPGAIRVVA